MTAVCSVMGGFCNKCAKMKVSAERDGRLDSIRVKNDWEILLIILIGIVSTLLLSTKSGRASIKAAESRGVRFQLMPATSFRVRFCWDK